MGTEVHELEGRIVLAQEDRFRLELDDGRSILLILGSGTGRSMGELEGWAATGRRVHLRFRGREDYGPVAEEVLPL